jgi:hypothetical protein
MPNDVKSSSSQFAAFSTGQRACPWPLQMKQLKLTKGKISRLQEAAIKVSAFIDTLNLNGDERTDLYAALFYAHVKHTQNDLGDLTGLQAVLERFSIMVGKLLANKSIVISRAPSSSNR